MSLRRWIERRTGPLESRDIIGWVGAAAVLLSMGLLIVGVLPTGETNAVRGELSTDGMDASDSGNKRYWVIALESGGTIEKRVPLDRVFEEGAQVCVLRQRGVLFSWSAMNRLTALEDCEEAS